MFENIIGYDGLVNGLRSEITTDCLPQAALFVGQRAAGKLTVALECARGLTCYGEAPWTCRCTSCEQQRLLIAPVLILVGYKAFMSEIRPAAELVLRDERLGSRYLFVRAVRKLVRRFDAVLWEGEEHRIAKIHGDLADLGEVLDGLDPAMPYPAHTLLAKHVKKILAIAEKIVEVLPADGLSVNMVRRLRYWCHTAATAQRRVVVIEHIDRLQESARNALLKLLEEPPAGVWFLATTAHRTAVMPTLLSRLRCYNLGQRSPEAERQVVQAVFRVVEPVAGVGELMRAGLVESPVVRYWVNRLVAAIGVGAEYAPDGREDRNGPAVGEPPAGDAPAADASAGGTKMTRDQAATVLSLVTAQLRNPALSGAPAGDRYQALHRAARIRMAMSEIGDSHTRIDTFNLQPSHVLETLVGRFQGVRS